MTGTMNDEDGVVHRQLREERIQKLTESIHPLCSIFREAYQLFDKARKCENQSTKGDMNDDEQQSQAINVTRAGRSGENKGATDDEMIPYLNDVIRKRYRTKWQVECVDDEDIDTVRTAVFNWKLWCDIRMEPFTDDLGIIRPPFMSNRSHTSHSSDGGDDDDEHVDDNNNNNNNSMFEGLSHQQQCAVAVLHPNNLAILANRCGRMEGLLPVSTKENFMVNVMQFYDSVYKEDTVSEESLQFIFYYGAYLFKDGKLDHMDQASLAVLDSAFSDMINDDQSNTMAEAIE